MAGGRTLRIGDLIGARVYTATGRCLGKVADIAVSPAPDHAVTAPIVGPGGWRERLNLPTTFGLAKRVGPSPVRIPWSAVAEIKRNQIELAPGGEAAAQQPDPTDHQTAAHTARR